MQAHKAEKKSCNFCEKDSHLAVDCWIKKNRESKEASKKGKRDVSPEENAFIGISKKLEASDWCMDTGASEHMSWERSLFKTLNTIQTEKKVKIGDGSVLEVTGIGNIEIGSIKWGETH
ncbi:hypothetical protein QE152_g36191 [Popillia japonica]|uniref:Retrovirus-related Pol polyprotein from transposon TNT 1-94-like beta-barrel domain-containing protein n=1 Tax=Popillia japonica TaxID=7064 RepID=A0AAW1ICX6_POPJA